MNESKRSRDSKNVVQVQVGDCIKGRCLNSYRIRSEHFESNHIPAGLRRCALTNIMTTYYLPSTLPRHSSTLGYHYTRGPLARLDALSLLEECSYWEGKCNVVHGSRISRLAVMIPGCPYESYGKLPLTVLSPRADLLSHLPPRDVPKSSPRQRLATPRLGPAITWHRGYLPIREGDEDVGDDYLAWHKCNAHIRRRYPRACSCYKQRGPRRERSRT